MPGKNSKCKNKFCEETDAQTRISGENMQKFYELFQLNLTEIRVCFYCKKFFDFDVEFTTDERCLRHCKKVLSRINAEILLLQNQAKKSQKERYFRLK